MLTKYFANNFVKSYLSHYRIYLQESLKLFQKGSFSKRRSKINASKRAIPITMRAYFDKFSKIQETVVSTGNKDYIKTIKETL